MPQTADVLVVGAGLAGLACARHIHAAGRSVVVLEAKAPGRALRLRRHRDSGSIQGALVSGRRAATAALKELA